MKTGTVKWFNARKGYGFIKPVDGGFDVYVHIAAVERAGLTELKEGQKVCFEVGSDERTGETFAEALSLVDGAPPEPDIGGDANFMPFLGGFLPGRRALR
jgi:CspA family cold shock protein